MDFRIVGGDRVGDVLQGDSLAGLRWRHDQTTLTLADRRHNIDETAGELARRGLLLQTLLWVQRGEFVELRTVLRGLDGHAVDGVDGLQRYKLLTLVTTVALTRGADGTVHRVAFAQAVLLDLAHGDVHVVRPRQIAGRTHESVRIEHVDDARDWHEILFRLLVALFTFDIAIRAIVTVGTIIAIIAIITIAVTATTIVTLVIIAVTSTQTASAMIRTIVPVAGTTTNTTCKIAILGFAMALVVLVALRRQRGENVVEIAHDILILRLLHRTAATTRLGIDLIVLAMATTVVLLRRSIIQSQFGEQIGGRFRVTATTALRSLVKAIQSVHSGHNVRGILAGRRSDLLAAAGTLSALDAGPSRGCGSRLFGILSIIGLDFGNLSRLADLLGLSCRYCRSGERCGLRGAHGHAGRCLATGTGGLKRRYKFRLTHGGDATKAHLLGELLELRQFHVFKIRAGCHWFLPFP